MKVHHHKVNPLSLWSFPVNFELGGSPHRVGEPFGFYVGLDDVDAPTLGEQMISWDRKTRKLLRATPLPFHYKFGDLSSPKEIQVVRMARDNNRDSGQVLINVMEPDLKWRSRDRWSSEGHLLRGFCCVEEGEVRCLMGDLVDDNPKDRRWSGGLFVLKLGATMSIHSSFNASFENIWLISYQDLKEGPVAESVAEALSDGEPSDESSQGGTAEASNPLFIS